MNVTAPLLGLFLLLELHPKPFEIRQDKEFFQKYLSSLVGNVFGEELMDKTDPDYYMVNFLRDDVLDEEGCVVEEAPKVGAKADPTIIECTLSFDSAQIVNGRRGPSEG